MKATSSLAPIRKRLQGKVAVIIGGASGIGESTARLFVRHGAKVVIADVQDDLGYSLCDDIASSESISFVHCDVSSESDVKHVVDIAVAKHSISGNSDMRISELDREELKRVFDVNVFGAFFCAKNAARVMIPAKKGSILFTSSVASVCCYDASHTYTASKHAVVGLTKNLCIESGKYGIRVNCISPYAVATPMLCELGGTIEKHKAEEVIYETGNLKEVLEPEDVAKAALYLGSDEAKYVSGLNLVVDGGISTTNPTLGQAIKRLFP